MPDIDVTAQNHQGTGGHLPGSPPYIPASDATRELLESQVRERTAAILTSLNELEAFCHSVSHDLRASTRAIHGYASILLDEHHDTMVPESRDLVARMPSSTE